MEDYRSKLEGQLKEIETLLEKSNRNLEKLKSVPDHEIRIHKSNGHDQYHLIDKATGEKRYVKKAERLSLRDIAQKGYEKRIRKELLAMRQNLEFFIRNYNVRKVNEVYERMGNGRKALIDPLIETDEMFIKRWQDIVYEEMQFYDETELYTYGGIRVRSKSELIIANMLEQYGVPFKYEKPLQLRGMGEVRPDFSCLKVKSRKEVIWEHFGMMDNLTYANKNVTKLACYHQNGFYVGENLITTFETSQNQISSKLIRGMIEQYLL